MRKILLGISVIILTIFTSCSEQEDFNQDGKIETATSARMREDDDRVSSAIREMGGEEFQTTVLVEIQNIEGEPLSGVKVAIGNSIAYTNHLGIVFIPDATLKEKFGYVTAEKPGYFNGSRAFIPNSLESGIGNQVKIKLFSMDSPTNIDSEGQSVVTVNTPYGNGSVTFNGGFTDENGIPYNGSVDVYTAYIDPLNSETGFSMPGDLLGLTTNNEINVLGTYGMVNVEIRGDAGQELQIVNSAEIRLPIANDQLSDAPDEIPMWYFNETSGLWIQEGIGYKQGNEYTAIVNHFTPWNWDIPIPGNIAVLSIEVRDQFGNQVNNAIVKIETIGFVSYRSTGSGIAFVTVPPNIHLFAKTISIGGSSTCLNGTPVNTTISPISGGSIAAVTLNITTTNPSTFTVSGTLNDCTGSPLATPNGWVGMMYNGNAVLLTTNTSGVYSNTFTSCISPTVNVVGFNANTKSMTPVSTLSLIPGTTTHNINFPPCFTEYIQYSIDGGLVVTDNLFPGGGITAGKFSIQAEDSFTNKSMIVSQTITKGFGYKYGKGANQMEIIALSDPIWAGSINHAIKFDLMKIGAIGMPIEVNFTGTFDDSSFVTHTITGKTYILRDF